MPDHRPTESLDCLFISPPIFHGTSGNIWREINSNFPPLGLASVAACAHEAGYSTKIIDCNIESPSVDDFEAFFTAHFVNRYISIRFIGLTGMTCNIKKGYRIAMLCKKHYPGATIVFGGVHATFVTEEVINKPFVDLVVVGEGELTMLDILKRKNYKEIKGLAYKEVGEASGSPIIRNEPRDRILDLDKLPMPAYDMLPILKYHPAKGSYKRLPAMAMMTSRGCPGRCTFCNKTLGLRLVFTSAQKIFEQITHLIDHYGTKEILFYDDTFTVNKRNVIELCDLLIKNKTDISWTCFARVDCIDQEMLGRMKKAGCHQIMYGVENIDENVLRNINKKIRCDQVTDAVRWTKEARIECRLAFMVGNPGDNVEIIKKNIEFINKLNPDLLIVNIATPFPGTEMFDWAEKKGLILSHDWDDYNLGKPVMKLENMSSEEIKSLYRLMYRSFYFRPRYVIKKILSIRTWDDCKMLFGGFKALLSFFQKKKA